MYIYIHTIYMLDVCICMSLYPSLYIPKCVCVSIYIYIYVSGIVYIYIYTHRYLCTCIIVQVSNIYMERERAGERERHLPYGTQSCP